MERIEYLISLWTSLAASIMMKCECILVKFYRYRMSPIHQYDLQLFDTKLTVSACIMQNNLCADDMNMRHTSNNLFHLYAEFPSFC